MVRQWGFVLAAVGLLAVIAACGRVNLEDLTPEAVKTEQAQAVLTQAAVSTAQSGSGLDGDAARGQTNFNVWCNGCHAAGGTPRGPNILGNQPTRSATRTSGNSVPIVSYRRNDIVVGGWRRGGHFHGGAETV